MIGFRAEINENAFCALRNEDYHSGDRNCHRHQRSIGLNHCRFQLHEVSMATATASHFVSETRVPLRNFHHPIVVCSKRLDIDSTPTPPHPPSPQCMHIAQWPHLDSRTFSGWKTAKPFKFGESFQIFIVSWNCSSDMADGHFYVASKRRQPGPLPPPKISKEWIPTPPTERASPTVLVLKAPSVKSTCNIPERHKCGHGLHCLANVIRPPWKVYAWATF